VLQHGITIALCRQSFGSDLSAGLDFYVGILGFIVIEDCKITARTRWLVIALSDLFDTKIILAKASTEAQIRAIGLQTGDRVGFFLHSDAFATDYHTMRAAEVVFEETPRQEPYGWVAVWRYPFRNHWDLLQRRQPSSQGA
jgi:hypothetical protein